MHRQQKRGDSSIIQIELEIIRIPESHAITEIDDLFFPQLYGTAPFHLSPPLDTDQLISVYEGEA